MTKMETIKYEWCHKHYLSPKSFKINQHFINIPTKHLGKRYVYNNINKRDCLLYTSINMEKYYFHLLTNLYQEKQQKTSAYRHLVGNIAIPF